MPKSLEAVESAAWSADWEVRVRVWVEREGKAVLGEGRADLLAAIDRTHSISAAARLLEMSYRHAWMLVQQSNAASGEPLVIAAIGGAKGGGAQLTPRGKLALAIFSRLRDEVRSTAATLLQRKVVPSPDVAVTVHLAAAISLQEVTGQLLTEYALNKPGVGVRAIFGASNELADHILTGALCDVFISADASHLDRLAEAGSIAPETRRIVAGNSLVAIGTKALRRSVRNVKDLVAAQIEHIALADPACPLGKHSHAFLRASGNYESFASKVVQVDNSRGVLAALASGRAQAGLAFASDAAHAPECRVLFSVAPSDDALVYSAAVVRRGQQAKEAQALVDFFASRVAQRCFRRCGFTLPN